MKRFHVHVRVKNLADSIAFYNALFNTRPTVEKPDYTKWMLEDPRVNWTREGVVQKSWFKRDKSVQWNPTQEDIAQMKEHFVQFISLASGGPVQYKGQPIRSTHADLQITKPEFDAAMGDLKATLDKLNIDSEVQKELMSIFESTRPEIVPKSGSAF